MQEVANQAAKAGCDARAVLTRYSSRDMPVTDSDSMSEAERATALKFVRLMQVRTVVYSTVHSDMNLFRYHLACQVYSYLFI